jgi:hypothetical protein
MLPHLFILTSQIRTNSFNPADKGSMFLPNVGVNLQDYTLSKDRLLQSEQFQPGKAENLLEI